MRTPDVILIRTFWVYFILLNCLMVSTIKSQESCPSYPYADLSGADAFANDDRLPFRFPLDNISGDPSHSYTQFCSRSSWTVSEHLYHAAEDFLRPAGTPVYAMADGHISFSGKMRGYGWLIIIDHTHANIYSLYGHLSPSRWRKKSGLVDKGELIAYIGDSDENGGSAEHPLIPHLHLGVRAGMRSDYSSIGEWRWQAGWLKSCPTDLSWLQPSVIITKQDIPVGGFRRESAGFMTIWWRELLFSGIYIICGLCMLITMFRKNKPFILMFSGLILMVGGWYFYSKGMRMSLALFTMAVILSGAGIYQFILRIRKG